MNAIETENLRRTYEGGTIALKSVNLSVPAGTVHGLLGPNGAGKTTLVKILATMLMPTAGRASIYGLDVTRDNRSIRRVIGVALGGDKGLYQNLTGRQLLEYWCALYKVPPAKIRDRSADLISQVGLNEKADTLCRAYSRGMKQRLHLARSLVGDPKLVILDEPTIGLDPVSMIQLRSLIGELRRRGKTVLLTTHDLREADLLCDAVTLIDRGEILASEDPARLARLVGRNTRVWFRVAEPDASMGADLPWPCIAGQVDGEFEVESESDDMTAQIIRRLLDNGVREVATRLPSLEQVYLHYVGHGTS